MEMRIHLKKKRILLRKLDSSTKRDIKMRPPLFIDWSLFYCRYHAFSGVITNRKKTRSIEAFCGFKYFSGISFLFEVYQLFSAWGGPDITDVILNGLGVYLGILLYNFLSPRIKSKVINTCALVTIVIAIPLDIFAIINSIINFPGF